MADRIARLRALLAERGIEGAVLRRPANVYYLTGHSPGPIRPGFAVVGPERTVLVGPGRAEARPDVEAIGYRVPGATVDAVADVDLLSGEALAAALEQAGLSGRRVGV